MAHLLRTEPSKRLNYMRLIKLLYIADRESIRESARPISGARPVAMERGCVLGQLYDLIKGTHERTPAWATFFRRDRYELEMLQDPGNDHLSPYDARKLTEVADEHADHDEWDLVRATHTFQEWQDNQPAPGSSRPIPVESIFRAVGREDFSEACQEAGAEAAFEQMLRRVDR